MKVGEAEGSRGRECEAGLAGLVWVFYLFGREEDLNSGLSSGPLGLCEGG